MTVAAHGGGDTFTLKTLKSIIEIQDRWTMEDLRAHFKMGYAPNNCTLVVVGAASFEQVMGLAKKYLERKRF